MADDLDLFYAEIAKAEAEVAEKAENEPGAAPLAEEAMAPSTHLPPPPVPPPTSVPTPPSTTGALPPPPAASAASLQPLPAPPRPPPNSRPAVISQKPVIAAPPQPVDQQQEPSPSVPSAPIMPQQPPPPASTPFKPPPPSGKPPPPGKKVGVMRSAAGEKWVDPTLTEWPENDFRIFVGNLAPEVTDAILTQAFSHYETFQKARVVRNPNSNKSKGFGFVSFGDAKHGAMALREMHGQYIASRPCQLKRSKDDRTVTDRKGRAVKRFVKTQERQEPPPKRQQQGPPGGGGYGGGGGYSRR